MDYQPLLERAMAAAAATAGRGQVADYIPTLVHGEQTPGRLPAHALPDGQLVRVKVSAFLDAEGYSAWYPVKEIFMRRAAVRGWLIYTQEPRSLRFGPTYLASARDKVEVRQPMLEIVHDYPKAPRGGGGGSVG